MPAEDRATVLVAEDDRHLVRMYAGWLEPQYAVRTAFDGVSALKQVDRDVDVVLLDRKMPRLSGDEVLGILRALGAPCRVAILSGFEPDFDIYERGYDEYLVKPCSREELRSTVEHLENRKHYIEGIAEYYSIADLLGALETRATDDTGPRPDRSPAVAEHLAALDDELNACLEHLAEDGDLSGLFHALDERDFDAGRSGTALAE